MTPEELNQIPANELDLLNDEHVKLIFNQLGPSTTIRMFQSRLKTLQSLNKGV